MRSFAPLSILVALVACSSGPGGGDPPTPPPPTADTTAPTVPAGLTATPQSPTEILLSWTASTDAGTGVAGYRVFRDASSTPLATVTTSNYTDSTAVANATYTYTVSAYDRATPANESALSGSVSATTPPLPANDNTPPSVPANVTAVAQSSSQIQVTWSPSTDASGISGYRVFRNGGGAPIATVQTTSYTDTGLTAATQYSYTVVAVDAATPANVSAASAPATATTSATAPVGGLDSRPSNTTCLAGAAPDNTVSLNWTRVFASLGNFNQPIALLQEPASNARWYVVEKTGTIRVFDNTANVATSRVFLDVSSRLNSAPGTPSDERGLLGMAFHPDWPATPRVYLFYTGTDATLGLVDRISEFRSTDGGNSLALNTELELLNVDDPESNHNGGNLAFGPDGMLYIGIGDGGGANDAHGSIGNGQLLTTLLGKMLRINVSAASQATPYTIPPTNPFAANARCTGGTGAASCPEIYAYGFRNPWRWSFDRGGTHELWLNDVGQGSLEEIDNVVLGGNYGWRCFEGTIPSTAPAAATRTPSRPSRSTGVRRASRPRAASSIAAAPFPR